MPDSLKIELLKKRLRKQLRIVLNMPKVIVHTNSYLVKNIIISYFDNDNELVNLSEILSKIYKQIGKDDVIILYDFLGDEVCVSFRYSLNGKKDTYSNISIEDYGEVKEITISNKNFDLIYIYKYEKGKKFTSKLSQLTYKNEENDSNCHVHIDKGRYIFRNRTSKYVIECVLYTNKCDNLDKIKLIVNYISNMQTSFNLNKIRKDICKILKIRSQEDVFIKLFLINNFEEKIVSQIGEGRVETIEMQEEKKEGKILKFERRI
ncbi:MAG TPA: hypothetical protein PKY25_02100 [Bacilli bacterium]|nr:hypothetical protein [Bacilli bacterium]